MPISISPLPGVPSLNPSYIQKASLGLETFLKRKDIGFPDIPERDALWQAAQKLGTQLRVQFHNLVFVGIGGSSLGPRVLSDLFQEPQGGKKLFFCDNVDPWEFDRLFRSLDSLDKTCWVFVSKSGTTIETLTALDFIQQKLGQDLFARAAVISENRPNALMDWAAQHHVPTLEIPVDVGGRFSVLSSVGLLPAVFLGVDIARMRSGAKLALESKQEIIEMAGQALASFDRNEWITQFWFYSSGLKNLGAWLQQLWAESLAKAKDRTGQTAPRVSTPLSQVGACDQHSVLQQVMEGNRDKFVVFCRVQQVESSGELLKQSQFQIQDFLAGKKMGDLLAAEAAATQEALAHQGVSTMRLTFSDLGPESLGEIFMFWQLVVATMGECLNINAFDQPGVELGKRLAKESLKA